MACVLSVYQRLPLAPFFILAIVRHGSSETRTSVFPKWALALSSIACLFWKIVPLSPQVKCDHYWPFTEEPIAYGDITVEMISEEERDDWARRHFRINYVSHEAHVQVPSPCWGDAHGSEASPRSGQTVSSSHFAMLLSSRDKSYFEHIHFPLHPQWCGKQIPCFNNKLCNPNLSHLQNLCGMNKWGGEWMISKRVKHLESSQTFLREKYLTTWVPFESCFVSWLFQPERQCKHLGTVRTNNSPGLYPGEKRVPSTK